MPVGFFGKLACAGDFVARGLAPGVRPVLDRWLTLHLAPYAATPEAWPDSGLHAVISGPDGALALAIIASCDTLGRRFPLAACSAGAQADQAGIEGWARDLAPALHQAAQGILTADALFDRIGDMQDPAASDTPLRGPLLWSDRAPAAPTEALQAIFANAPQSGQRSFP